MNIEKLTRAELNRKIAELREAMPKGYPTPMGLPLSLKREWSYEITDTLGHFNWIPNREYLYDPAAALELLHELCAANLPDFWFQPMNSPDIPNGHGFQIGWKIEEGHYPNAGTGLFCFAICLAWVQWRTGTRVELTD